MNNSCRKRHLQPLTYTYYDLPLSKRDKRFATLSAYEQSCTNRARAEHPELDTHLHSVMLIPPPLVQRFNEVAPTLEGLFQRLDPANRSLHAAAFPLSELRRVLFYSSQGELRRACLDFYAVLPKSKREPIYTKPVFERELERALIEDRKFRRRHVKGIICEQQA